MAQVVAQVPDSTQVLCLPRADSGRTLLYHKVLGERFSGAISEADTLLRHVPVVSDRKPTVHQEFLLE
jgi:hypothetical protein